jgi:hypothetical protein
MNRHVKPMASPFRSRKTSFAMNQSMVVLGFIVLMLAVPLQTEAVLADFLGRTTGDDTLIINILA